MLRARLLKALQALDNKDHLQYRLATRFSNNTALQAQISSAVTAIMVVSREQEQLSHTLIRVCAEIRFGPLYDYFLAIDSDEFVKADDIARDFTPDEEALAMAHWEAVDYDNGYAIALEQAILQEIYTQSNV